MEGQSGFSSPEEILSQLAISENMAVADFGCGHGYFTLPLARLVSQGRVAAIDVLKEALEAVENKARLEQIENIQTIRANLEVNGSSKLADDSMDLVFLRNILFQSQKKAEIVREAKRVLKTSGRLVVIEWQPQASLAPRGGWLIGQTEAQALIEKEGFLLEKELSLDKQHYGLVFKAS